MGEGVLSGSRLEESYELSGEVNTSPLPKNGPKRPNGFGSTEPSVLRVNMGCRSPSFRPLTRTISHTEDVGEEVNGSPTYRVLPIFSGLLVPFAILLAIPSLTDRWYIRTGENHVVIESQPNPWLLITSTSVSMACAILACACLVVRFAERAVKSMTLLAIAFLTVHGAIAWLSFLAHRTLTLLFDRYHQHYNGHPFWRDT